jgi:hypothetical protein
MAGHARGVTGPRLLKRCAHVDVLDACLEIRAARAREAETEIEVARNELRVQVNLGYCFRARGLEQRAQQG